MKKTAFIRHFTRPFCALSQEKGSAQLLPQACLSLLACTAALAASTYALFSAEVTTAPSTIQSAHYAITAVQAQAAAEAAETDAAQRCYTLTAGGTASTGYCEVLITEDDKTTSYNTPSIAPEAPYDLTIIASQDAKITFTAHWGAPPEETIEGNKITTTLADDETDEENITIPEEKQEQNNEQLTDEGTQNNGQQGEEGNQEPSLEVQTGDGEPQKVLHDDQQASNEEQQQTVTTETPSVIDAVSPEQQSDDTSDSNE